MAEVAVVIRVDTQGAESAEQLIRGLDGAAGASGRAAQAGAELAAIQQRQAQAAIQLATAEGDHAKALSLIQSQLDQTSSDTLGYLALLGQQEAVERRASAAAAEQASAQQAAAAAARRRAAEEAAKARAVQQSADAEIRLAIAERDYGRALSLIQTQLGTATAGTARYSELLSRQATVARQAETAQKRLQTQLSQDAVAAQRTADATAKAQREQLQIAQSAIRAAVANRDYGRALSLVQSQLTTLRPNTLAYNNALADQARISHQAADANRSNGLDDLISNLGIAGLAYKALTYNIEAYKLAAQVEGNQQTIRTFIGDVHRANEVLEAGERFGRQYAYSQTDVAAALRGSSNLFQSTARKADDALNVLGRLAERRPEEGLAGAARAVDELLSGDVTSIKERFNISGDAARELKAAIEAGHDPVDVLNVKLNELGTTNELLANRTRGALGAQNEFSRGMEDLKLSVGRFLTTSGAPQAVSGLGKSFSGAASNVDLFRIVFRGAATDLAELTHNGLPAAIAQIFGLRGALDEAAPGADQAGFSIGSLADKTGIYSARAQRAGVEAKGVTESLYEQIAAAADSEQTTLRLSSAKEALARAAAQVRAGTLDLGSAQAYLQNALGLTQGQAERLLNIYIQLGAAQAQLNLVGNAISNLGKGMADGAKNAEKYQREQDAIAAAQYALLTNEQKLAALRQRLAGGKLSELERLQVLRDVQSLQQQIAAADARAGKAATTAANKAERSAEQAAREAAQQAAALEAARDDLRTTEEKLADRKAKLAKATDETSRLQLIKQIADLEKDVTEEREKQLKAALDARELALDDAEADAEALKRREQAQAILRNEATSEAQKAAARRTLERLRIEDAQRALELAEKQREAGGQVAPVPGTPGAPIVPGTVGPGAAVPLGPVVPVGLPSVAIPGMVTPTAQALRLQFNITANLVVDGRVAARAIFPTFEENIVSAMNGAFDRTIATGALETGGPN